MSAQPVARVASRHNPLVSRFRRAAHRRENDDVLLEGATLVEEARRAGWAIHTVAFSERARDEDASLFAALGPEVSRVVVTDRVLDAMSPVPAPSGVVALGQPRVATVAAILAREPSLVVVAIDIQDPGNVGAIVRTAEAAGATGMIAAGVSADPFGWKALRGAMGSAFRLPLARETGLDEVVAACRHAGLQIVATAVEGVPLPDVALRQPTALLLGAEGSGLSPEVLRAADVMLTIPMQGAVESLNVAVAAGIILYEARRQRRG